MYFLTKELEKEVEQKSATELNWEAELKKRLQGDLKKKQRVAIERELAVLAAKKFDEHRARAKTFIENPINNSIIIQFLKEKFSLALVSVPTFALELDNTYAAAYLIIDNQQSDAAKILISPLNVLRLSMLADQCRNKALVEQLGLAGFFKSASKELGYNSAMSKARLLRLTASGNYAIIFQAIVEKAIEPFGIEHLLPHEGEPNKPFDATEIFSAHQEDDNCKIITNLFINNTFSKMQTAAKTKVIKFLLGNLCIDQLTICIITANLASNTLIDTNEKIDEKTAALFYLESLYIRIIYLVEQAEEANDMAKLTQQLLPPKQAVEKLRAQLLDLNQNAAVELNGEDRALITGIEGKADRNGSAVLQKLQEAGLVNKELSFLEKAQQRVAKFTF